MRTRACALALLVTLSPAVFPVGAAFADDAMTEMARQRFQEGVKFFDQKKFEEARAAFLQAYALKRHPAVLLNLAQSELRANRPADAARHFAQYLRDNSNASPLEKQDAERGLAEARAKAGRVVVTVNATGADVFIDDELVGKAPLAEPVDVATGERRIEARLGEQTAAISVTATAGKVVEAKLAFGANQAAAPMPMPAQPFPPPAENGYAPQPAPIYGPGPMDSPGYYPEGPPPQADSGTYASTGQRQPFFPWLTREPIAWATLGVTAVGLGVGTYGAIAAVSSANKVDDLTIQIQQQWSIDPEARAQRPNQNVCWVSDPNAPPFSTSKSNFGRACARLNETRDAESRGKTIATIGFVAAGVGVAGTAVAYLLTSKKKTTPSAIVTPVYGPEVAGIAVTGSF